MTSSFNAASIPLEDFVESLLALPTAEPLSGEIVTRAKKEFGSPDGRIAVGTWETEPGSSRWDFLTRGEVIVVLSGYMTVAQDGEEPVELRAGDTAVFPIGWRGVWTVHERLRKVYVVYAA